MGRSSGQETVGVVPTKKPVKQSTLQFGSWDGTLTYSNWLVILVFEHVTFIRAIVVELFTCRSSSLPS